MATKGWGDSSVGKVLTLQAWYLHSAHGYHVNELGVGV